MGEKGYRRRKEGESLRLWKERMWEGGEGGGEVMSRGRGKRR